MGEEQSHKDSFDLELNPAASSSSSVQWMQFPTSSHIESLRSSDGDGYVTLIRSSGFRQSSCTESKPHLGCLLWNSASLQKGFPRLQFFPRWEFKISGRSLVGREQERYRWKTQGCVFMEEQFHATVWCNEFWEPRTPLSCFDPTPVWNLHKLLGIWHMGQSLISAGVLSGQASPANQDP